jgi:hypothetical protein
MKEHHDCGRTALRLRDNRNLNFVSTTDYTEPSYPIQRGSRHYKSLTRIYGLAPPLHPPTPPRHPLIWSWHSRKGKRLYLRRMKERAEQEATTGLWRYLFGRKAKGFDFIAEIAAGKTLLVGEGNLSFAFSLTKDPRINPGRLTATVFERLSELSPEAEENAKKLRALGVSVLGNVDATKLSSALGYARFDNIIFQFPHAGSRDPVDGHNPNFILVRDFLKSAARQLARGGKVLISAVDSPHYRGAFQFEEVAEAAGFAPPQAYPFDPGKFRGYRHTMTHQPGSALDNHDEFATWVFRLKS